MMKTLIFFLQGYRQFISPALHALVPVRSGCRFPQTCSEFVIQALKQDGLKEGLRRSAVRVIQCHPISMSRQSSS